MAAMAREKYKVARAKITRGGLPFEQQLCSPAEKDNPLIGLLIVPLALGRGLPVRDDPLDPNAVTRHQGLKHLALGSGWQVDQQLPRLKRVANHLD